ncbi:LAFA_0D09890g1_1 [Lachancea sp. 'fantastica']|nr:LAFA_0D09890g1_1 [Lachancea sp. 'fantastica']
MASTKEEEEEDPDLDWYHSHRTVQLPPISSFDNLVNNDTTNAGNLVVSSEMPQTRDRQSRVASDNFDRSWNTIIPGIRMTTQCIENCPSLAFAKSTTLQNDSSRFENTLIASNETAWITNTRTPQPQPEQTLPSLVSQNNQTYNDPTNFNSYQESTPVSPWLYGDSSNPHSVPPPFQRGYKQHKCPTCGRSFARSNDLQRHRVRHLKDEIVSTQGLPRGIDDRIQESNIVASSVIPHDQAMPNYSIPAQLVKRAFRCPYNPVATGRYDDLAIDDSMLPLCHPTGIFSRGDTYKNHLRALHFIYPSGTRKSDRSSVPGKCRHCQQEFDNVEEWLKNHAGKLCGII